MRSFSEQCNGIIAPDGSCKRLPILHAQHGSSAVFWVRPSSPVGGLMFKIGKPDKSGWQGLITMTFHPKRGMWRAYVSGRTFRGHYETAYRIVATDADGGRHVEGEGVLRVHGSLIPDINDDVLVTCLVKFPDGMWRKVTVTEDDAGTPSFTVGEVAATTEELESLPDTPYAYNKATGLFHVVSGEVDEAGEHVLHVSSTGIESGVHETFVLNETTNLYYRIEATVDSTGTTTLVTGDTIV